MADSSTVTIIFYILSGVSLIYFFSKNDEYLAVILLFFYSSCLSRYDKIMAGTTKYVYVAYSRNIFSMTDDIAYQALNYLLTGTAVFCGSYILLSLSSKPRAVKRDTDDLLRVFLQKNQTIILGSFIIIFILTIVLLGAVLTSASEGTSLAYGQSYAYYFGFALSGMILLMFLAARNLTKGKDVMMKWLFYTLIVLAGIYTYDINNRFRFLSWIVGVAIIFTKTYKPTKKFILFGLGGYAVVLFFSFVGVLRMGKLSLSSDPEKIIEAAQERLQSGEDQNMLDGMMMIMQVYPNYLPYATGMEHIEILLRPIPRSWWPGKPLGSYINKLGLNDNMEGSTVGISPSLYGSFYAEGGLIGIIFFSFLYAFLILKLFQFSTSYGSEVQYIIKGMIISSTIPLLRGGDLPGIVAFIGMAFWPVFVFIYYYNGFLRQMNRLARTSENQEDISNNLLKLQQSLKPESLKA
jgi:hypothetical protein